MRGLKKTGIQGGSGNAGNLQDDGGIDTKQIQEIINGATGY